MKTGIIYKAINKSNGKVYIGKTVLKLTRRKDQHIENANNSNCKEYNTKFYRALRKYKNNFNWDILYNDIPIEFLNMMEVFVISNYCSFKNGYNSTIGGDGAFGFRHNKKTKRKLSDIKTGISMSEETKNKISNTFKLSGIHRGIDNPFYGKKHSKQTKLKISEKGKNRKKSEEHINKISISNKNTKINKIKATRPIFEVFDLNNNYIGEWQVINECAENLGLAASSIVRCLKNKQQYTKKYTFRYKGQLCQES